MEVNYHRIKQLRTDKGWTQQQLAEICGLSLRTIQRIEKLGVASMESVNALCSVLNVERSGLLTENDSASYSKVQQQTPLRQKLAFALVFIAGVLSGSIMTSMFVV